VHRGEAASGGTGQQGEVWPILCTITHALLAGNKSSSLTLLRHSRRQKAELNSALGSAVTLPRSATVSSLVAQTTCDAGLQLRTVV
jgi:hypothetical protein